MTSFFKCCGFLALTLQFGSAPAVAATANPSTANPVALLATDSGRPTTSTTRFLMVAGGRIGFDDTGGTGPLILAMPGMGDLRAQYRFLRPALQRAGYRVVTMDVRGFGDTSARWGDYSARAIGQDALALIEHLQVDSAVLIGNSFAAGSALWAAHDAPARVRGVVLIGPVVRDRTVCWLSRMSLRAAFAGPWDVWAWMTYRKQLFPAGEPADHADVDAALERNLHEAGRMAALAAMIAQPKAETEAIVAGSHVPALVVMGTRDPDFPDAVAEADWLTAQLQCERLLVDGAGHYPHTELPDAVIPRVLAFIERLRWRRIDSPPQGRRSGLRGTAVTAAIT